MRTRGRPAIRAALVGGELGSRLVWRQPSAWLMATLSGLLLGVCRGLSRQGPLASPALYSEILAATVMTASWIIALRVAPQVRAPDQVLLGAFPGGDPPVHPCWVVGGAAGGICGCLLAATGYMVVVGLLLEPGQWGGVAASILPVSMLAWMGGCSIALWVLILSGGLPRSVVLVATLALLLVDLAPPGDAGWWVPRVAFFPVSPASFQVDDWVDPVAQVRWLAAAACHLLGLGLILILTTRRRPSTYS